VRLVQNLSQELGFKPSSQILSTFQNHYSLPGTLFSLPAFMSVCKKMGLLLSPSLDKIQHLLIKEITMKTEKVLWIIIALLIGTLSFACSPAQNAPEDQSGTDALPPVAVVKARQALAADLNVDIETITIESYERAEWSDSCLGLGGPAESCLAAIYPGWQVNLSVAGGDTYEVRTDELGDIIRINK
jgi:hypothetical protein